VRLSPAIPRIPEIETISGASDKALAGVDLERRVVFAGVLFGLVLFRRVVFLAGFELLFAGFFDAVLFAMIASPFPCAGNLRDPKMIKLLPRCKELFTFPAR